MIEEESPKILHIDESVARAQTAKLKRYAHGDRTMKCGARSTRRRPPRRAGKREAMARFEANTMPYIVDAVRAYATVGEIS